MGTSRTIRRGPVAGPDGREGPLHRLANASGLALSGLLAGCAGPPPSGPAWPDPPVPTVSMGGGWVILEEDAEGLTLRWRDTADGVRVQLAATDDALPGVAPIAGGATARLVRGGRRVPLVGLPDPTRGLSAATLEVQGPDLVVRLAGDPLDRYTDHPDAPEDPVLTWVRIRRRADGFRIVVQGLATLTLPAEGLAVHHHGRHRVLETAWGRVRQDDDPPAVRGRLDGEALVLDTLPSLERTAPYPRMGFTWTPDTSHMLGP